MMASTLMTFLLGYHTTYNKLSFFDYKIIRYLEQLIGTIWIESKLKNKAELKSNPARNSHFTSYKIIRNHFIECRYI